MCKMYSREELISCLSNRMAWYEKSITMKNGNIPFQNGFDFPSGNVDTWEGCYAELKNTLDMLKCGCNKS